MNTQNSKIICIKNLNTKIKKNRIIKMLYFLLIPFGDIERIYYNKKKLLGVAFVTYSNVDDAEKAVNELKNFTFLDKQIELEFSFS